MGVANRITVDIFIPVRMFPIMSRQHVQPTAYTGLVIATTCEILGSSLLACQPLTWPGC